MRIQYVVFLNTGKTKVNQQVIGGRCLVLNSPWCSNGCDTVVRKEADTTFIESNEIVAKVKSGEIVYLESVYCVDENVKFIEISPVLDKHDFFVASRHMLSSMSNNQIHRSTEKIFALNKRRICSFVIPVILHVFRTQIILVLSKAPAYASDYVMQLSVVAQKGMSIKRTFGEFLKICCNIQKGLMLTGSPLVFVAGIYKMPISFYVFVLSSVYRGLMSLLVDAIQLFNNCSYNPLKKRTDSVMLNTDQIFMSVLVFSFCLLIMLNIMCFHVISVLLRMFLELLEFSKNFIDFVFVDTSQCSMYSLVILDSHPYVQLRYRDVSIWTKIIFAAKASLQTSEITKQNFITRLLFGIE
ncbi:hypothetical protein CWI42_040880 [Ordospora colligata]|uniref:Uncharacterized protein n=1 Tax=Ordospora colligata OC4 TaxID=1354746 RepID=A0A0B2UKK7_9MICR|nr:uncharacterized protein M896_040880 [Ordospora colligata OC4]KHN69893.1 hypothetical protein M896_040880 [Ordospora colligata OC4]TBU16063.1 hypothetical protein CWI41_040880 [Ordospora colligata]TBU16276.1 hypothetical protein CWI40_040880 [Ordospora colligata]TBU18980.1 hypothetical protein CWI42_040880 [Ordospora colligata]